MNLLSFTKPHRLKATYELICGSFISLLLLLTVPARSQESPSTGNYLLQNVSTGQFIGLSDDTPDAKLVQQAKAGKNPQRFEVELSPNGYKIRSIGNVYFNTNTNTGSLLLKPQNEKMQEWTLDNSGTSGRDAFTIKSTRDSKLIGVNSATDTQIAMLTLDRDDKRVQWRLLPVLEAGRYKLRNISTNLFMSVAGGSKANGAKIEQADDNDENWQLFDVVELGYGDGYSISPVNSRKSRWLSVNRNTAVNGNPAGTQLFAQSAFAFPVAGDEQSWEVVAVSGNPSEDDRFTIRSLYQSSLKFIGVQNATASAVTQTNFPNTDSRLQWQFVKVDAAVELDEGRYQIQNVATGKFMEVNAAATANGTKVVQANEKDAKNQQYKLVYDGDKYRLSPVHTYSSKWLSVQPSGNANGTDLFISETATTTQVWDIQFVENGFDADDIPLLEESDLSFTIQSELSGKFLGITDVAKSNIVQQGTIGSTDKRFQWRFIYIEPNLDALQEGRYLIRNVKTAKVMDVANASQADNAAVIQYKVSATDNQLFDVTEVGENQYRISAVHTNGQKWLSVNGGTATDRNSNGKTLTQLGANPSLQTWHIVRAENDDAYTVRSTDPSSKKLLGVYSSTDPRIVQWNITDEADTRFQWRFMTLDDFNDKQNTKPYLTEGRYQIVNKATKKVWDIPYKALDLNTVVNEDFNNKGANQQFDITINDNGQYIISPVHSRGTRYVLVNGTSKESNIDGTALRLWNSQHPAAEFEIYPLEKKNTTDDDIVYAIRSKYSNLDIGVHNHSGKTEVMQWNYTGGVENDARFQWSFEPMPQPEDVKPGRYIIQNVATRKVLDVTGMGKTAGTPIVQFAETGGDNQKFELKPNGSGYTIRPLHATDLYLNVSGAYNANGSPVTVWVQDWRVEQFGLDFIGYDSKGNPVYTITSLFSNLNIGVHDSKSPQVIQWNVDWGIEYDPRFQWRFIPTTSAAAREMIEENASIAETTAVPQVDIFPNPTSEAFAVKITEFEANENLTIVIADNQGNQVLRKDIGKERELNFDTEALGLKQQTYVIQIHNGSDKRVSKILKFDKK